MRVVVLICGVLVGCASTGGGGSARDAELVTGTFTATNEWESDTEGTMTEATDCLTITSAGDGAIAYDFVLNFAFDHQCAMKGTAVPEGPGKWVDVQGDCRLVVTFEHGNWTVYDPESTCRIENCGARGSIGQGFSALDPEPARACE